MPLSLQLTGAEWNVQEVEAETPEGKPLTVRMLFLLDPVTGIAVQAPFEAKEADDLGSELKGEKKSDLVTPEPGEVPSDLRGDGDGPLGRSQR